MSSPKMAPKVCRLDIRKKQNALISMCTSMASAGRRKTPLARPRSRIRAATDTAGVFSSLSAFDLAMNSARWMFSIATRLMKSGCDS
jgi:hypothetical protein